MDIKDHWVYLNNDSKNDRISFLIKKNKNSLYFYFEFIEKVT